MTRHEYTSLTSIKDEAEAKEYLKRAQAFFVGGLVLFIAMNALAVAQISHHILNASIYQFLVIGHIVFYLAFIAFCYRLILHTKRVTTAHIAWSLVFAPLSWIWFYSDLVKPLKIISGDINPPSEQVSELEMGKKRTIRNIVGYIFFGIALLSLALNGIAIVMLALNIALPNFLSSFVRVEVSPFNALLSKNTEYSQHGVSILFPHETTSTTALLGSDTSSTITIVHTEVDGTYLILRIYDFSNEDFVKEPGFNFGDLYDAELDDMLSDIDRSRLSYESPDTLGGRVSRNFRLEVDDRYIEGTLIYYDRRLYSLIAEYDKNELPFAARNFFDSFKIEY